MYRKSSSRNKLPELWGGFECTINRIGDVYRDQLCETGYYHRSDNVSLLKSLGVKGCRYPVLWERYEDIGDNNQWAFVSRELDALRDSGIKPIVGLLHHGSGPRHTRLDDPHFADKFESYAKRIATRYPWVSHYTPVNEPLTTARFSGLYGFWYPHLTDALPFARMLITQLKGTVLAMRAIREVNPAAKLVQTEDLGKVHSTGGLQYQADFENSRRWLTFDFLCGKVDHNHALWKYLLGIGIGQEELEFFLENTCTPDILGLNYYVTSERYLDERCQLYPHITPGGNGKDMYVDTEAFRVGSADGIRKLLVEAWRKYELPLAITEVHLGCTREEQMRWLQEIWNAAQDAANDGVPVEAVTAWSLFGSVDWNSLLTRNDSHYESGIFDVRTRVRRTALANMITALGAGDEYKHPLLYCHGWWRDHQINQAMAKPQSLLVIGRYGSLANAFSIVCQKRGIRCVFLSRHDIDIMQVEDIIRTIAHLNPWGIVNACGISSIDDAEKQPAICFALNAISSANLAEVCALRSIPLMIFSSDQVFDGAKGSPYSESDEVSPINCFGASKALAEALVSSYHPKALIIRTSAPFGPWDGQNFAQQTIAALQQGRTFQVVNDTVVSPTYVPHLVNAALDLFIDGEEGLWHLCNKQSALTWCDFATTLARRGGYSAQKIIGVERSETVWRAPRPLNSALASARGAILPSLDDAIGAYLQEVKTK